jgi:K(+)-stimulated pyrophosphate-energized sodium pump
MALLTSAVALAFAMHLAKQVMAQPAGNAKMQEIALAIQEGANAFLTREYSWLAVFVGATATLMAVMLNLLTALCFVLGAIISGLTGYLGATPPSRVGDSMERLSHAGGPRGG